VSFGKGWKRNVRPFARTFSAVHPLSLAAVMTDGSDLTSYTAPVMDQGPTEGCTGHAVSDAAVTAFAKAGQPLLWVPSPAGIYVLGNAETRAAQGLDPASNPLTDSGAYPSDVMVGVDQFGLRAMGPLVRDEKMQPRFSDADAATVIAEPDQAELEEDAMHTVESHAILHGPNVIGDLCAALVAYPAPTGIFVDTAFQNWNPLDGFIGAPVNPYDPDGGGHYVDTVGFIRAGILAQMGLGTIPAKLLEAFSPTTAKMIEVALAKAAAKLPPSDPIFIMKNSWTKLWGLSGFFLATKALITAPTTSDLNAVLPVMKEAA
jgi:hypothetical protein